MGNVLITGAAGFIGSHTVEHLLQAGQRVIGVDSFRTGRIQNLRGSISHPLMRLVEADARDCDRLTRLCVSESIETVIHLAALVSVPASIERPDENFELNVAMTHAVAEAARKARVSRVVFASSAAVYGDPTMLPVCETTTTRPLSPYGAAKLASEALLLGHAAAFGLTVRVQRYFNVYGERQDPSSPYSGVISIFADRMTRGEAVTIFGDGSQTRDFVMVRDVAEANVAAALRPALSSGCANICTGIGTDLRTVHRVLGEAFGHTVPPRFTARRQGEIAHSIGNPNEAERALGFRARVRPTDGLTAIARQMRLGNGGAIAGVR
jgi:UDP-glucose 4-epimerase